jgi:oligopeptide transport system substrate-binding protein
MTNRTLTILMGFVAVLILAVGVVAIAVLAGGGGNGNQSTPGGQRTPRPQTGSGICNSDTLITFGSDPLSVLDPIQVRDEGTAEYIIEIFGGLVTLDLDMNIVPDIAERWDVSPDGRVYTFTLRNNVVFHSGKRVTAQDVKYSLERAADPANNSPTVMLYLADIVGVREKYRGQATEISGVKVIDERTIEITIDAPKDYFLAQMTYSVAFVVNREQIERDPRNWTRRPDGTGPFRLQQFTPAERIVLVRNDRYHLGAPKLASVSFELAGGSLLTRYENNELHIGLVPAIELEAVRGGRSPLSADYRPEPRMTVSYIAFNASRAPFDDPKVRQALAMAVDREGINDNLLFGTQRVADGILPPEMPGYSESIRSYQYNPERARQLLAESRYANNMPRLILTYAGAGGASPDILTAIQDRWRRDLGLDVQLQASDPAAFLRELRRGTFQMYSSGWAADYPDPEDFIDKLFHSQSQQNESGFSDPEIDRLVEQARTERDRQRRYALYHEAEQKLLDDAVIIPIFWPVYHYLVKPCVQNWPSTPMTVPKYRYIEIKPD